MSAGCTPRFTIKHWHSSVLLSWEMEAEGVCSLIQPSVVGLRKISLAVFSAEQNNRTVSVFMSSNLHEILKKVNFSLSLRLFLK